MGDSTTGMEEHREFIDLMAHANGKSAYTQKSYRTQYKKLREALGTDVSETNEENIISVIKDTAPKANSQQALLNIAIMVRKVREPPLAVDKLIKQRESNRELITTENKEKNVKLAETLPKLEELEEYLGYLFSQRNWLDYIINYLLLNFQVRNQDLILTIVPKRADITDNDKNYLWLSRNKVTYVRGHYKTSSVYDSKIATITDKDFVTAVRKYYNRGDQTSLVPNPDNVGYFVKKATYKQLGEGAYMKVIVQANLGSLQKLKEISDNRGTSLETMATHYDIKLQD
jgi:hypothetical protein